MEINNVQIKKVEKDGSRMKGIASIMIDDCFIIRNIRIIEGDSGLFLAMPSRKNAEGEYHDIAHPINAETRKMFEDAIFSAYEQA